jgi:cob(I)alamin adenosyltransferase
LTFLLSEMKIYTRTGDDGTTSLPGGRRIPKHSVRIEAIGSIDELIAWIGLLRSHGENVKRKKILLYIQKQLMSTAGALASDTNNPESTLILPDPDCLTILEKEIDKMAVLLPSLESFIIPGGNIVVSHCHITRNVCRRAERRVIQLHENEATPEIVIKFLNRLSDYLFILARLVSLEVNNEEITSTF